MTLKTRLNRLEDARAKEDQWHSVIEEILENSTEATLALAMSVEEAREIIRERKARRQGNQSDPTKKAD